MSWDGWAAALEPSSVKFLLRGLYTTLLLAVTANAISLLIAIPVGTYRERVAGIWRWPATLYVDIFRNIPVLVLLFFLRFAAPIVDISVSSFVAALVGLTVYNGAHLSEVVRAGIGSVPNAQSKAAMSSGLSRLQTFLWIVYPQALRNMLPALLSQFVILVQASSLATAINVIELTRSGQILFARYGNPMEVFAVIALMYFLVNFSLSVFATRLHASISRKGANTQQPGEAPMASV